MQPLSYVPRARHSTVGHGPGDLDWSASVRRLVAALEVAVRHPSRWVAGLGYQLLALGWLLGIACVLSGAAERLIDVGAPPLTVGLGRFPSALDTLAQHQWSLLGLAALAVSLRLAPGLARSMSRGEGLEPRTPALREGRGLGLSTLALWVQIVLIMLTASAVAVVGLLGLFGVAAPDPDGPLPKVAVGVMLGLLGVYGATLGALFQLALASLARHDRGTGSALLHAWRLVRSQPSGASRAIVLDAALYGGFLYVDRALAAGVGLGGAATALLLALSGLARASFWSRTYHALGGVEPVLDTGPVREPLVARDGAPAREVP